MSDTKNGSTNKVKILDIFACLFVFSISFFFIYMELMNARFLLVSLMIVGVVVLSWLYSLSWRKSINQNLRQSIIEGKTLLDLFRRESIVLTVVIPVSEISLLSNKSEKPILKVKGPLIDYLFGLTVLFVSLPISVIAQPTSDFRGLFSVLLGFPVIKSLMCAVSLLLTIWALSYWLFSRFINKGV